MIYPMWIRKIEIAINNSKNFRNMIESCLETSEYYYDKKLNQMVSNREKLESINKHISELEKKYKEAIISYNEWLIKKEFE